MNPLLIILLLLMHGSFVAYAEEAAECPIVVEMKHESPYRPEVNGKSYSFGEFKRFLSDIAQRFGSKDPVIIRLDEDKNIQVALILVKMAHQTHDSVAMEISPPKSGGATYRIQIPKDGIKTVIDGRTARSAPPPIPDINPNGPRDTQIQRLYDLQNGILETK